ncbi:hypothetical protein [Oceanospirillum linum]|uniref:hypothetical protein n=1 Tax=Oceanospirillum linum TaxID=966 RepID=UPI00089E1BCD|nr:hypothetical protein [Oceanospirillum linum]SEG20143.1 hypothetical protein SAMN04489856_10673 [Oleiphilus messinensis]SMP24358.1 hypothetical protein SAMN06264348_10572 [Oceanospirillum linum]
MTLGIIRTAARAMRRKKSLDAYDLPEHVKRQIARRHFSAEEINEKYKQSRRSHAV